MWAHTTILSTNSPIASFHVSLRKLLDKEKNKGGTKTLDKSNVRSYDTF